MLGLVGVDVNRVNWGSDPRPNQVRVSYLTLNLDFGVVGWGGALLGRSSGDKKDYIPPRPIVCTHYPSMVCTPPPNSPAPKIFHRRRIYTLHYIEPSAPVGYFVRVQPLLDIRAHLGGTQSSNPAHKLIFID